MATRILVVERDRDLSDALVRRLRAAGFDTDCTTQGTAVLPAIQTRRPDVVLLDTDVPGLDGIELSKRLKSREGLVHLGLILLSEHGDPPARIAGLEAGADDYLSKPVDPGEVVARIKSLMRRLRTPPVAPRRIGRLEIDLDGRAVWLDSEPLQLTRREFSVLAALIQGNGRVVPRLTLLREAWGQEQEYRLAPRTVDVHVARLRHKLGPESGRLITLKGVGYRFDVAETA